MIQRYAAFESYKLNYKDKQKGWENIYITQSDSNTGGLPIGILLKQNSEQRNLANTERYYVTIKGQPYMWAY